MRASAGRCGPPAPGAGACLPIAGDRAFALLLSSDDCYLGAAYSEQRRANGSNAMNDINTVHDNPPLHRFELEVDGHIAFSEYARTPDVITFMHTEVPEAMAGKGIGSKLIRGALDLVRADGLKVIALCPFVKTYIEKHPDIADLLKHPTSAIPPQEKQS
jgi:predicted GNAT family acetyltransferase